MGNRQSIASRYASASVAKRYVDNKGVQTNAPRTEGAKVEGSIASRFAVGRRKFIEDRSKQTKERATQPQSIQGPVYEPEKLLSAKMEKRKAERKARGTDRYKDPETMTFEEINSAIKSTEFSKKNAHKMMASFAQNGDAIKQGWDDVETAEEVGADKETFENYRVWHNREIAHGEYLKELKESLPKAQQKAEVKKLKPEEKDLLQKAIDYRVAQEDKIKDRYQVGGLGKDQPLDFGNNVKTQFPELAALEEKGIDIDYLIESGVTDINNQKQMEKNKKDREYAKKHPVLASVESVGSNLMSPLEIVEDISHGIKNATSDKHYEIDYSMHPFSQKTQEIRGAVNEGIDGEVGKFLYNAGMATADSAANIIGAKGIGGAKTASALMGSNVANQRYQEVVERGGDTAEAFTSGIVSGLIEALTEKYSIESFDALKTVTVKNAKDFAKNIAKQSLVEGSEEAASSIANHFTDNIINGSKSEYNLAVKDYVMQGHSKQEAKQMATKDFLKKVGEETLAGALSGSMFGSYANTYSMLNQRKESARMGKEVEDQEDVDNLVAYAKSTNPDIEIDEEKLDSKKVGEIAQTVVERASEQIESATNAAELNQVYDNLSEDIPESIGSDIDLRVRSRALALSKETDEKEPLYEIANRTLNKTNDFRELTEAPEEKTKESPSASTTHANFKTPYRATFAVSDEPIQIQGFREIGTEDVMVETTEGEVVPMSELSFEDENVQNLMNIASTMDNASAATVLVSNYDGKENAGIYANNFRLAYNFGRQGDISFDKLVNSSKQFRLMSNQNTMRLAYELGKAHKENQVLKPAPEQKERGTGTYYDIRKDEYSREDGFNEVKKSLAKKTGLDVFDFDETEGDDGQIINGFLDMKNGQMAFAETAENKFSVMIHETLEFASVMSEPEYQKLMRTVLGYMIDKHGTETVHDLIQSYKEAYENVEGNKSFSEATQEMINDAVSGVFYDKDGAKAFIDWVMEDKSLDLTEKKNIFQKIADLLKYVYEKIMDYIDNTPLTKTARMTSEFDLEQKKKIRQLYIDAVEKAGQKYQKENTTEKSSDVRHSIKVSNVGALRHSLSGTVESVENLIQENKQLKETVELLKSEFEIGGSKLPDGKKVREICQSILKNYNSTFDLDTFQDNVTKLYRYMNEENADYEAALKITSEIARGVLEKSTFKDTSMYDQYKDLREYFRKTKLSLTEAQKSEVAYQYGSIGAFRKSNFGRLRITDNGTSLDQVWGQLSEQYPEFFKEDTTDGDMITVVLNTLDGLRPTYQNIHGEDMEQASYDLALQIYSEMSKVPKEKTFRDKVEDEKNALHKKYADLIMEYRKGCRQQYEEGIKRKSNEFIEYKQRYIKTAYGKIKDLTNAKNSTQADDLVRKYEKQIANQRRLIERMKVSNTRKISEMQLSQRKYRENQSEQKKQTEQKNKIRRLHYRMRQMLMKPTQTMYIPKDLVNSTITVLEVVNLGAKEGTKFYAALDAAQTAYEKLKSDPDFAYQGEYDESVGFAIDSLKSIFRNDVLEDGASIYDLTSKDLERVYNAMNSIYQTIRRATKLIREEGIEDAREAGKRIINEVRSSKGVKKNAVARKLNKYALSSLNAKRAFRRMSGYKDGEMMVAWKELNDGQLEMLRIQQEGEGIFSHLVMDEAIQKVLASFDKKDGLVDSGLRDKKGKAIMITKGMRMALVMHGMNKDNLRHMIHGGVIIPDMKLYAKGKRKRAYEYSQRIEGITSTKIDNMKDNMSKEELEILKAFKKLFHEYTGKVINETSMKLYGYKKANETNYYPIHVDKDFIATDISSVKMDKTIEGSGFLKERIKSTKPIVLESIVDTSQRSIDAVSRFGGLAIPIRNFNKIYNSTIFKVSDAEEIVSGEKNSRYVAGDTVKNAIKETWGTEGLTYIDNLLADLQNARASEVNVFDVLRGNFAGGVLTGNLSVIMKQAASYPTAAETLGWEPLMKALVAGGKNGWVFSSADRELIAKYTPLLWYRNKGNSTKELADLSSMNLLTNKLPVVSQVKNMIQKVDVATVGRLWYASQYYVDKHHKKLKKGTDAYYRKVAEMFNQCVEDTQPNYTVMQRPDILRSKNGLAKTLLMFMTQRLQNYGIIYDATCNLIAKRNSENKAEIKRAKEEFARAVSSQLISAAVLSTMTFFARALLYKMNPYRDDENEITFESIFNEWLNGFLSCLAGCAVGGNELYNLIYAAVNQEHYYGIEVSVIETINNLGESITKLVGGTIQVTEGEDGWDKIKDGLTDATSNVASMCGVPIDNINNILNGISKNVQDAIEGEGLFTFSLDKEEPKESVMAKKIYDAIMEGDKATAKEYREKMKSSGTKGDGDVQSAVQAQLVKRNEQIEKAAVSRLNGDNETYIAIYEELKKKGFTHNEIIGAINNVISRRSADKPQKPREAGKDKSMYSSDDLIRAIDKGKGFNEIVKTMYEEKIAAGKDKKTAMASIRSAITKEFKQRYQKCETAREKQEIIKQLYEIKIDNQCLYNNEVLKGWNN